MIRVGSEGEDIIVIGRGWHQRDHFYPWAEGTRVPPALSRSIPSDLEERWSYFVDEEQRRHLGESFEFGIRPHFALLLLNSDT